MAKVSIRQVADFTGGLNFRADQFQLKNNESPRMLNVEIDPRGGVFSRGAQQRLNATAVPAEVWSPQKLFPFYGDTSTLMLTTEANVFKCTGTTFAALEYSAGNKITSSNFHGPSIAQWGKSLYIATGTAGNGGYFWQSGDAYATQLTASGTNPNDWQTAISAAYRKLPTAEYIYVHANKMFAANTKENGVFHPNRLRWSWENAPENWAVNDYIDVNGGGDGITGLAVVGGNLVIFKPYAIYVLYGYDTDNFQVVELSTDLGVHSKHSIAQTENGVYFYVRKKGIYFYNGSSIEYKFDNLKTMYDDGHIANSQIEAVSLSWVNNRLWVSLPYSDVGAVVGEARANFIFEPRINDGVYTLFKHHDGYGLIGGCDWTDSTGEDYALMIHPTLPRVIKVDMYDEEQDLTASTLSSFESYYRTKWQDGGNYIQKKMWRRPDFVIKETDTQSIINIKVFHDFAEGIGQERRIFDLVQTPQISGLIWGTGTWGNTDWASGASSSIILKGNNLGLAKTVQIEFTGPLGKKWGLNSIGYKFQSRKVNG